MCSLLLLLPLLLLLVLATATCFVVPPAQTARAVSFCARSATKTTLTEETTWRLRFLLKGIPTEKGKKVDQLFVVDALFIEDEGYEPPQGYVKQILSTKDGEGRLLEITKGRWKLSEDPNDRKDGLWVWGLFKEPLYPFMLLQLETAKIPLPGEDGDSITPLTLFAQINHSRDAKKGVILSQAVLKVREMETMKADPFGASLVDVYEEVSVGQLTIQSL